MNNSTDEINGVTQTTRMPKTTKKPTVKEVPVIPVVERPSVVKPKVKPVTGPILKQPKTDTVKLKVVRSTGPVTPPVIKTASTPVTPPTIKPASTPVVQAPTKAAPATKTVKIEKTVVLTKTVKLMNAVKKDAPESKTETEVASSSEAASAPEVSKVPKVTPPVSRTVIKKPVRGTKRTTIKPKKSVSAAKKEISFDVSDFEDESADPSALFMIMNLASAAMFVAGLVIALVK